MWTVVKKELRGYFNSAIALIFLFAFLAVTLYMVFWHEKLLARGIADLRPLFSHMPEVLIILVAALAMRMWADERRAGTLEILLTLPMPRWQLVIGKFLAGLALIAIALALTLGLPLTVSMMGNLDTGPVIGGYLAALLLSAAYLAIGMCVSAATDNQIVAFVGTALACGIAYAVGELGGEVAALLGTGTRFDSIARGVLDLRDLAYYAGIVAVGISVNVVMLQRLAWGRGVRSNRRRAGAVLGVGLVLANAIALGAWLSPVRSARIDLTTDGTYSLSSSTARILANLDERLLLRGYFSERMHPKLAPLVPQLRDLLEEYRVIGRGKVRVELVDPTTSDDAKREAKERFGIDPTPLRFATETEKSVINAYFAIAIEYGDQHAVLTLDDLIAVRAGVDSFEVSLKNPEYELTRTIKKTVAEFASVDTLFASTPHEVKLTAYLTPKTLPENWKDAPTKLKKVVDELVKQSNGKLAFAQVEPKTEAEMKELFARYGLRPYADVLSDQVYYFHLLLQVGDRMVRIVPPQNLGEADLKSSLTEGLQRAAPGFTRVVGLWSPPRMPPQMIGDMPHQIPTPLTFDSLRQTLAGSYEVRDVPLTSPVPDEVEALVLAAPSQLTPEMVEHVDQFVMRGGALIGLAGHYRLGVGGLRIEKAATGLEAALTRWGITLGDQMVMDTASDVFPIPQNRDLGNGLVVQELHELPYPFFAKIEGDRVSSSSVITGGLSGAVMHWASPVKAEPKLGDDTREVATLLRSSAGSWLTTSTQVEPDPKLGKTGFAVPTQKDGEQVLAVAIAGGFTSAVAKPKDGDAQKDPSAGPDPAKDAKRLLEHSPPDTRIVWFGSSNFVADAVLDLGRRLDSELVPANLQLVHNAVDWALADTDLLAIRSRAATARHLTVPPDERGTWRTINFMIAFLGLGVVVGVARLRRRGVEALVMEA